MFPRSSWRRRMDQADDLKAFERRMMEIVSSLQPSIRRWRVLLMILICATVITFYLLITDESSASSIESNKASLYSTLFPKRIFFFVSFSLLICAFLFGIHRKVFASSIIIARFQYILADYNMSCDSDGRLILKPRPTSYLTGSSWNQSNVFWCCCKIKANRSLLVFPSDKTKQPQKNKKTFLSSAAPFPCFHF